MGVERRKLGRALGWLPILMIEELRLSRRIKYGKAKHLVISIANHFEPHWPGGDLPLSEAVDRVERWCEGYRRMVGDCKDHFGNRFVHTYFYPAEEYNERTLKPLRNLCGDGYGEIEIHLHHGIEVPDNSENLKNVLQRFKSVLIDGGCLGKNRVTREFMYGFVHGNFALGNINKGAYCGVDSEIAILAETGCYADFTMPALPDAKQVMKINRIYQIAGDLGKRAAQKKGTDCRMGSPVTRYPLVVVGPLVLDWKRRKYENGCLTAVNMPTRERLRLWRRAHISVMGKPDWLFIKLHCHGLIPADSNALLGESMANFLHDMIERDGSDCAIHFVTCREMFNIICAACDGRTGDPQQYREYVIEAPSFGRNS